MAPVLLVSDGIHLSQRVKRVFAHNLVAFIDRAFNQTQRGRGIILGLPVISCGLTGQGQRDRVLARALSLLL